MKPVVDRWRKAIRKAKATTMFKRAVLENRQLILDSNIAQLQIGIDSFGQFLREYASDAYAHFKQEHGSRAPFGIADLKLTGDFHSGFVLKYTGGEFVITSTDSKTDDLVAKYGKDIFGLANESIEDIRPHLQASFIKLFRNELL